MYSWILGAFFLRYYFQEDQINAGWVMVMIKENKGRKGGIASYISIDMW